MAATQLHIALAGNPNCGKTTLFNLITGQNGYVGNWPGVTVEKKEAKLSSDKNVTITDLPGIYSLSPYSPEERVSRDYLMSGEPDAVIQLLDATNLERNLYLALQVIETGLPVVVALNMADLVERSGDKIDTAALSRSLGCPVVMISALKNTGIDELFSQVRSVVSAQAKKPAHHFDSAIEDVLDQLEALLPSSVPVEKRRYYAVKLFERDEQAQRLLQLDSKTIENIEEIVAACERDCEDDAESIITGERYAVIAHIIDECLRRAPSQMSTSEKIDRVVTNRILGLPIFAAIMFAVYFLAISTFGTSATDFTNDQIFDAGWFVLGQGREAYDEAAENYGEAQAQIDAFIEAADERGVDTAAFTEAKDAEDADAAAAAVKTIAADPQAASINTTTEYQPEDEDAEPVELAVSAKAAVGAAAVEEPDPSDFGPFVPGIPSIVEGWLKSAGASDLVIGLVNDGAVAGVGAVLGFIPQMFVLFVLLTFLEDCGYMARVAFVMDRVFRRFGLSGKSFIPMLVSTGCGVPGVLSTKTIENERDRRMTVMTTTFIPCGAKLPIIALLMGALVGDNKANWIAPLFYFLGVIAVIGSGIMLKKTKIFAGRPTPFVMELPSYHMPSPRSWVLHVWERVSAYIKKAFTIIFASTIVVWFLSNFGVYEGAFGFLPDLAEGVDEFTDFSILAMLSGALGWIFAPLGFESWQATAMSITGLVAKENVIATAASILHISGATEHDASLWTAFGQMFPSVGAVAAFGAFNLLCAPCFAAMGTIRAQMNSAKWTAIALGYECAFAWVIGLMINQFYLAANGVFSFWTVVAVIFAALILFQLFRPMPKGAWGEDEEEHSHLSVGKSAA
ncbi:ferrous iron transporter B [Collinsella sp. AGMB00827]|uniref:Ferrous iron transporter B n=1 Tax=Collinsella ureilytica TaxID=2869515 RepID=A0ABS7MIT5_9ACTN|nr:ferrous iron transporter B [Collinsella urealyticum]MBY4797276.1 ferrous iron transporter B [Collinsella urealyticum]